MSIAIIREGTVDPDRAKSDFNVDEVTFPAERLDMDHMPDLVKLAAQCHADLGEPEEVDIMVIARRFKYAAGIAQGETAFVTDNEAANVLELTDRYLLVQDGATPTAVLPENTIALIVSPDS